MMFKSEQEMVDLLQEQLPGPFFQRQDDTLVLSEVNLGYGIADLVVTQYSSPTGIDRKGFLGALHITILDLLQRVKSITIPSIEQRTRASKRSINQCVKLLVEESFASIEYDVVKLEKEYSSSIKNTIAIEAKLKNWKRALNQAYRYKSFSNESYVCMPEASSRPAVANLQLFIKMEVGLFTISKAGELNLLYNPPTEQPINHKMNMLLNERVLTTLHAS